MKSRQSTSKLIVHHSLTPDGPKLETSAIRRYHTETLNFDAIGYHYLIERVGPPNSQELETYEIIMGRPSHLRGAHSPPVNAISLGICLVGDFTLEPPPSPQLHTAAKLCASLCITYKRDPVLDVLGHREVQEHRACPGEAFDLDEFRVLVRKYIETPWSPV